MLNFGQDIGWGSPTKYDSYGRYIWEIKACYLVMAPLSPCPPGAYLTSQVGLKFIYNAKFWACYVVMAPLNPSTGERLFNITS